MPPDSDSRAGVVSPDEIILRRLLSPKPGAPATTQIRPGIGLTATSFSLRPRRGEQYPSWSRLLLTSPERLVELAAEDGCDVRGAHVCAVAVQVVRELRLDVVPDPTPADHGHCLIVPTTRQPFTDIIWKRLAQKTRIVHTQPDGASAA